VKELLFIAALAFSHLASATVGPALIDSIPQSVFPTLEARIKASVQQQTGFKNLKNFKVAWNDIKNCLEVKSEMNDSKLMGTCSVGFSAFQVSGEALVIVKQNGYGASVIYVDVE
jgi:hypothetical protein